MTERTQWNSTLKPGKGFKSRSTPLPRETPLARSRKPLKQTRGRKCYAHLRDPEFKAWVRTLRCLLSGREGHVCKGRVEFSHVIPEGRGAPDRGNGLPLCGLAAHREGAKSWHTMGPDSWQAHWGIDAAVVAAELGQRYEMREGAW